MSDGIDPRRFRAVLGRLPTAVAVVTGQPAGADPVGMTIGSVFVADPADGTVGFLPGRSSGAWQALQGAGSFCVNLLSTDDVDLSARFAAPGDRFEGVGWTPGITGAPRLDGVLAWMECRTESVRPVGDHDLVLGRIVHAELVTDTVPLVFCSGAYGAVLAHAGERRGPMA